MTNTLGILNVSGRWLTDDKASQRIYVIEVRSSGRNANAWFDDV